MKGARTPPVFIRGTMDSLKYQKMMEKHLLPFLRGKGRKDIIFQQDNAPCHASKSSKAWFQEKKVPLLSWPPKSPDLSPIENAWSLLVMDLYRGGKRFLTVSQLESALTEAWNHIDQTKLDHLIDSMGSRIVELCKERGSWTHY